MTKRRLSRRFLSILLFCSLVILLNTHDGHAWCPWKHQNQIRTAQTHRWHAAARQRPYKEDDYYDNDNDEADGEADKNGYWEEKRPTQQPRPLDFEVDMDALEQEQEEDTSSQGAYYQVSFDGTYDPDQLQLDWEECSDGTMVLLPPTYVETPKCILHFVGGTFFGSSPKLWYRSLLEGIVQTTQCVVVATPIPVSLLKSPLQHVSIARKLQRQFVSAYTNVLMDEYDDNLTNVPIVGMGHSLGARLLTVLATLDDKYTDQVPPYQAMILMSFTNYGSAASIPGIQSLLNQSKRLEQRNTSPEYDDSAPRKRTSREYSRYDDDDDDDYDEEWEELMEDFQSTWREQASRFQTALTPASKELEFHPSPNQLWNALKDDGRYHIPNTLVVQFEQDTIDQSPRLTDCLLECSTDIKYCRLKGYHLTPISAGSSNESSDKGGGLLQLSKRASTALWKLVRGKQSPHTADDLRDLRKSISRYITDVVAAPIVNSENSGDTAAKETVESND